MQAGWSACAIGSQSPPLSSKRLQLTDASTLRNVGQCPNGLVAAADARSVGRTPPSAVTLVASSMMRLGVVLFIGVAGCAKPDDYVEPPPGPVAVVSGRVLRGDHPVAGVHVLARVTYGIPCSPSDSAPGGTVVLMTPTDSTGRFYRVSAYPASAKEQRAGCLYVGAVDPARPETVWAAPRRARPPAQGGSTTDPPPDEEINVPWPK